jgi:predicted phosphodiesterase
MTLKVAHLSDIHFFHLNKSLSQFFNKRFLANFNALFTREKLLDSNLAYKVLPFLKKQGVTHLIISGDFTSSSSAQEFRLMQEYVKEINNQGFKLFSLPGNHDAYTKSAHRNQLFFSYLSGLVNFKGDTTHSLVDDGVVAYNILEPWWLVLLDCSSSTAWHKSTGVFSKKIEKSLTSLLDSLPSKSEITVTCHYPFEKFRFPKAHLERGHILEEILANDKRIRIYLHGHRHNPRIEQAQNMILADSGSISLKKSSSFNLLEFSATKCEIVPYQHTNNDWRPSDVRETITCLG